MKNSTATAWDQAQSSLAEHLPPEHFAGTKLVLAVSGGADSVAMLHLVADLWRSQNGFDPALLNVAHYNHSLRGEASDGDQAFVATLAKKLNLPFFTRTASPPSHETGGSSEAAFRNARYEFLLGLSHTIGARYVLAAHTADDNVETFLHHLLRGSGPAGLAGIALHRSLGDQVVLYRPLLSVTREQLREALRERGLSWREDASNADERYQRNWIRAKLLPMIRERYSQANQSLSRTLESQSQIHKHLSQVAAHWAQDAVEHRGDEVRLMRSPVSCAVLSMVVRMIWDQRDWPRQGFANHHLRRLHEAIENRDSPSFTLPGDIQCRTDGECLWLRQGKG